MWRSGGRPRPNSDRHPRRLLCEGRLRGQTRSVRCGRVHHRGFASRLGRVPAPDRWWLRLGLRHQERAPESDCLVSHSLGCQYLSRCTCDSGQVRLWTDRCGRQADPSARCVYPLAGCTCTAMNPAARCDNATAPRLAPFQPEAPPRERHILPTGVDANGYRSRCGASREFCRVHGPYGPTEVALIVVSVPGSR
jgi:hypothetical protein